MKCNKHCQLLEMTAEYQSDWKILIGALGKEQISSLAS